MPRKKKPVDPNAPPRKPNPGIKNLRKFNEMSPEEHRALSAKGGKRTAELYTQRKTFREVLEWALELPAVSGNPDVDQLKKEFPNLSNRDAMVISMVAETIRNGNAKAFKELRDTTGEIPVQMVNVKNEAPMEITIRTLGDDDALPIATSDDDEDE